MIRARLLNTSEAVAKIRVGFIDCSDRAVFTDCAGSAGNDGYSVRSEYQAGQVELKYDGCAGNLIFDDYPGSREHTDSAN